jgi:hypothetical protein
MTTLSRGDERAALFHVLLNVIEMDIEDHLNIIQALSEKRCDGIYDFLLLDGETVDKLAHTDKDGSVHPLPIGYLYSLHRFRAFVAYCHAAGTPISPDEWLHLTSDEYEDYCEDLMERHTGSHRYQNIETLAESKQFDFVLADFYLSTVPYDDYDDITIEVDYDFSDYDAKTVGIDYMDTNSFDIAPSPHDEPTAASSFDQTSILLHRQPDPSVFVTIDEAEEFPCSGDSDTPIEECILHRTHDCKSTTQNGVPKAIDDNVTIHPSYPAATTYGDTISVHFCHSNDQNQTFDGDPRLNTTIMGSSNDSTENKTNILCISMGSRSYGMDSAISFAFYNLSSLASPTKFVSTTTLPHLLIMNQSPNQEEARISHEPATQENLTNPSQDRNMKTDTPMHDLANTENDSTLWTRMHYDSKIEHHEHDETSQGTLKITFPKRSIKYKHDKCASRTMDASHQKLEIRPSVNTMGSHHILTSTLIAYMHAQTITMHYDQQAFSDTDTAYGFSRRDSETLTTKLRSPADPTRAVDDNPAITGSSSVIMAMTISCSEDPVNSSTDNPIELCMGRSSDTKVQECCNGVCDVVPTENDYELRQLTVDPLDGDRRFSAHNDITLKGIGTTETTKGDGIANDNDKLLMTSKALVTSFDRKEDRRNIGKRDNDLPRSQHHRPEVDVPIMGSNQMGGKSLERMRGNAPKATLPLMASNDEPQTATGNMTTQALKPPTTFEVTVNVTDSIESKNGNDTVNSDKDWPNLYHTKFRRAPKLRHTLDSTIVDSQELRMGRHSNKTNAKSSNGNNDTMDNKPQSSRCPVHQGMPVNTIMEYIDTSMGNEYDTKDQTIKRNLGRIEVCEASGGTKSYDHHLSNWNEGQVNFCDYNKIEIILNHGLSMIEEFVSCPEMISSNQLLQDHCLLIDDDDFETDNHDNLLRVELEAVDGCSRYWHDVIYQMDGHIMGSYNITPSQEHPILICESDGLGLPTQITTARRVVSPCHGGELGTQPFWAFQRFDPHTITHDDPCIHNNAHDKSWTIASDALTFRRPFTEQIPFIEHYSCEKNEARIETNEDWTDTDSYREIGGWLNHSLLAIDEFMSSPELTSPKLSLRDSDLIDDGDNECETGDNIHILRAELKAIDDGFNYFHQMSSQIDSYIMGSHIKAIPERYQTRKYYGENGVTVSPCNQHAISRTLWNTPESCNTLSHGDHPIWTFDGPDISKVADDDPHNQENSSNTGHAYYRFDTQQLSTMKLTSSRGVTGLYPEWSHGNQDSVP